MNQLEDSVFFENLVSKTVKLMQIESSYFEEELYLQESFWDKLCKTIYGKLDIRLSLNLQTLDKK